MNLDDTQKQKVSEWIGQGAQLSEIQSKLASELGIRATYMELRFLLDDLKLKPKDKEPRKTVSIGSPLVDSSSNADAASAGAARGAVNPSPDPAVAGGKVSVAVAAVTRAGALVSGSVTFSDGNAAEWYLDQFGRLGLVPKQQGYKPSQQDLLAFQSQLQSELAKLGY